MVFPCELKKYAFAFECAAESSRRPPKTRCSCGRKMSFGGRPEDLRWLRCRHDGVGLRMRDRAAGAVSGNAHRHHTGVVAASAASARHHECAVQQGADAQDQHGGELFCFHESRIRLSRGEVITAQPQWFWQGVGLGAYPRFEATIDQLHCFSAARHGPLPIPATNHSPRRSTP